MSKFMFDTIDELRAHKFVGNFHDDRAAMRGADDFILRTTDRELQLEAFNIVIAKALGEPNHLLKMCDLDAALAETREFRADADEALGDAIDEFCAED